MALGQTPTLASRSPAGLVLAGGRSVRFGGEKAAALLKGKPLVLWAAERLKADCAEVAVSARPDSQAETLAEEHGFAVLHDQAGDPHGPLAGVRAGLVWAQLIGAASLAVSPCDTPLLPPGLFARLIRAAGSGAAVAQTVMGRQPLCAVWPVSALPVVEAAIAGGAHPPTWRVLDDIGAKAVRFEPPEAFANLNTREDLAAVAARLG
jgi:molybdopterin-guanine dinucleotide biosynthesis protein A